MFTDKIAELIDLKYGSRQTVGVKVTRKERSSISDFYVGLSTLWHGNDHNTSGYLQAHKAKDSFVGESVIKCKFYDPTLRKEVDGTEVIVHHVVKG